MSRAAEMVAQFHRTFDLPVKYEPSMNSFRAYGELRRDLIVEEANEFRAAVRNDDLVEAADALADLVYVVYGAAITFGLDLDAILEEVHRSNMTKLWDADLASRAVQHGHNGAASYVVVGEEDGCEVAVVYREDGKVLKPPTFEAPRIEEMLEVERQVSHHMRLTDVGAADG